MEPQSYIGGQAVIEGVMMRGGDKVAIAVRRPDRNIFVETRIRRPVTAKYPALGWPLIRGVVVLFESMMIGMEALAVSASQSAGDTKEELSSGGMAMTLFVALLFSLGLFVVAPLWGARWLTHGAQGTPFAVVEAVLRLVVFFGYIGIIARMKDIQRVFQYHGAEHKAINAYEAGEELTVENVRRHSLIHRRCGTTFLLYVVVISIVLFSFFSDHTMAYKLVARILLLPVVAGLAYEVIRFSGKTRSRFFLWLISPGLLLQKLTTREPDDDQIEVAIVSVKGVLGGHQDDRFVA